jgi:hypothetical protein
MKKASLFLGIVILIIAAFTYYNTISKETTKTPVVQDENTEFGYVTVEDLVVDGMELGNSTEDLGIPDRTEMEKYEQGKLYHFYYPNFKLICYDDGEAGYRIVAINITSRNIKTKRGIGIGSSETEVFERYGDIGKNTDWITYTLASDISKEISFKIIKGEVEEIAIYSGNNPFDIE